MASKARGGELPASAQSPPGGPGATQPVASILLVDDDEGSLRALFAVLEPLGQRLVAARSGKDALRRLLHEDFAVILLDMRMPGLDGLETAGYINARARTRHIPIIFLTAHARDVEQVMHAYERGAADYVVKPVQPEVLRSKVRVFVQLQSERAERVREARARAQAEAVANTVSKLQSVSDAALRHLELQELLPELVERARAVFEADAAGLLLSKDGSGELRVVTSENLTLSPPDASAPDAELLDALIGGSPLRVGDLIRERSPYTALAAEGLRSLIVAPLSNETGRIGALFLGSRDGERFSDDDLTVLALSADRAAIAIEHARSYERERGLAEALQRRLLPERLPEAPGLQMAARYQPSERAANVGGDWYDVIALPGQRMGLAIGDVVGHGVAAAALMGELRAALRAYAVAEPLSPARALGRLNALVSGTHGEMVATLLYAVLDVYGSHARFASAGHLPPLLLGADGSARYLEHTFAAPLGAADHDRFEDFESELAAGSTMVLYTDGLVERRDATIDAGLERLRESLRTAPADLEQLCSHLLASASPGHGVQDDIALLAVRRLHAQAARLEMVLPAEPESVPIARNRFKRWLASVGAASEQDAIDMTLALNEACTNTVQHAYGPGRGHEFRVRAELSADHVLLEVQDSGRWRAPRGTHGGRGLDIIEQVMDQLEVDRSAGGTTLRMRRRRTELG